MKNYCFYLESGDEKDATDFYIKIIQHAILDNGNTVNIVHSISDIKQNDIVVTIQVKAWTKAKLLKPGHKTINWYQGIPPEEMCFLIPNIIKRFIWQFAWTIFEILALRYCDFNIFVSEAIREHFFKKYGYKKKNYFIMPCFNEVLDESSINEDHYKEPSFVYTGGLQKWQCFEKILDMFKKIQEEMPTATLTIFTASIDEAQKEMVKRGIKGVVKYVPYKQLGGEISKIKYGFLIREDNEVNRVATPTKMNSYLANGVIPVYSTVIRDFKKNLSKYKYIIGGRDEKDIMNKISEVEAHLINSDTMRTEYKKIFSTYYSWEYYVKELKNINILK